MDGTILGQGTFTVGASVTQQIVQIPSGADWIRVFNYTQFGTAGGASAGGVEYMWQRGMPSGSAIVKYKINTSNANVLQGDLITSGGFTLYDPSGQTAGAQPVLGNAVATTASTNATRPVVSTATTTGLVAGTSVVRMSNTAQTDVNGIDMVVGAVSAGVSFTLLTATNALATAPGAIGGAGFYRIVNTDPLFYPRRRYITNITQASQAQVSTSVAHNYVVGQEVRFNIPSVSGMVQLNSTQANNFLTGTIVSVVDSFNFKVNIDTSAFTAFTFPTIAQQPSSFPEVTPVGEDTAYALTSTAAQTPLDVFGNPINNANSGILSDATVNTGFLGMILGTGGTTVGGSVAVPGPAGTAASDVVYWLAGKSTYGGL